MNLWNCRFSVTNTRAAHAEAILNFVRTVGEAPFEGRNGAIIKIDLNKSAQC